MTSSAANLEKIINKLKLAAIARKGDVVMLELGQPRPLSDDEYTAIRQTLDLVKSATGVEFVVLDGGLRVASLRAAE